LRVIAEAIDVPVEDLRTLNAHVLRWTTPPDDPDFQLVLPKGLSGKFSEQIAQLPESKRVLFREHVVRKGDTLSAIAKKYGTTTTQLSQANSLGARPALNVGQSLIIPMSGVTPPPPARAASTTRAAAVKSSATSTVQSVWYTVRAGDTLGKIAARFNTTVEKLKSWNRLSSTRLAVGKKLLVAQALAQANTTTPTRQKVIHEVKKGETLDRIATTYKTSVDAIISWNESEDLSVLHPGDRITIFLGDRN
jgi:membrane-bound lytic murein transglycosylase D